MPTLLTSDDKSKIKRHIPQASNKIITAGIARLYVALPGENRWKDSGLSGAAVLAYDEVGKCFFLKLVDVVGSQGILWDQELYDGFQYRQDRTFFHSFEISECIAAFSFADEHEARNFYSKVESRQKKVSGGTSMGSMGRRMKGLFGKADKPESAPSPASIATAGYAGQAPQNEARTSNIDPNDPEWAGLLEKLASMGITQDQIAGNEEFIKSFVSQKQEEDPEPPPRVNAPRHTAPAAPSLPRSPAPPPPPPASAGPPSIPAVASQAPRAPAVRNLPPPPSASMPPMRSLPPPAPVVPSSPSTPVPEAASRDSSELPRKSVPPPPPQSRSKNKPPPPPSRGTRQAASTPEPTSHAPTIPGKVPLDDDERPTRLFNVPPPFEGVRKSASLSRPTPAPPSVPARGGPPVPSRSGPPPVPGRTPGPPIPSRNDGARPIPPAPGGGPPPPPPMPPGGGPPPPPPMMPPTSSVPPPPGAPPSAKIAVPTAPGRDDLLASIRAGNKKGLRKTETVDKSAPAVPGAVSSQNTGGPAPAGGNDMASQLAAMLGERNKKVAHNSDNESDEDW